MLGNRARIYEVGTLRYTLGGLCIVAFWLLLGEFAIAFRDRSSLPSVTELLRQHGASDTVVALLVAALPALLGSVLVPLVGFRSDRFRSRWGRRLPFLMSLTPLAALMLVALGFCAQIGAAADRVLGAWSPGADRCVVVCFCLFWTLFEGIALVTLSLYSGLVNDIMPRAVLGRFYAGFRVVSLGAGILFNLWVFQLTEHHLREVFVGIGVLFGGACMLMCLRLEEGAYEPVAAGGSAPLGWRAMVRSYRQECFSDRYYLLVFQALTAAELAFVPFNTFSQLYAQALGMDKATLGQLLAISYAISMPCSFAIGWIVDRYSAVAVTLVSMAAYLAVSLAAFPLVHDVHDFAVIYVTHVVVSGVYYTACASLPMVLFPRARFLQFDASRRMFCSTATILLSFLLGAMLDATSHYYALTLLAGGAAAATCLALCWTIRRGHGRHVRPEPQATLAEPTTLP